MEQRWYGGQAFVTARTAGPQGPPGWGGGDISESPICHPRVFSLLWGTGGKNPGLLGCSQSVWLPRQLWEAGCRKPGAGRSAVLGPCSWLSSSGQPSLASLPGVLVLSFLWQVVARYILQSFLLPEAFSDLGQKKSIFLLAVLRALDFAPLSYCDAIVTWPWSPLVRRAGAKGHFLCPWYPGPRPGTERCLVLPWFAGRGWHGLSMRPMCLWSLRKP